ncbi:ECF-type riboflavin transporter substrate-binding protein [Psittacicella gerlachiana]|uniref:ECF transporter S component n=1 Tax=Psittacicella gerlachiana TaxID=2028574 RepID=A0A3A1YAW1_9GAMM|nr:ECF-type riboflavin transporter substrate-binding protein [Psittacicella gerlachiana]RIY34379.1 ECF transporter S component [Psittacicella gerlachiana]
MATPKPNPVKTVVAIGIGAAIIFILMRFVMLPTFVANTKIQTAFGFLALFAGIFGPFAAAVAAFIGHLLNDITQYGSAWFSWITCSGILGLCLGYAVNGKKLAQGIFTTKDIIYFNIIQTAANFILWALVAPSVDIMIYAEPENKVYVQGLVSAIVNTISVAIIGTALLKLYAKTRTKAGSLKLD